MLAKLSIFVVSALSIVGFGYGLALKNYVVPTFCLIWFIVGSYLLYKMNYPAFRVVAHFILSVLLSIPVYLYFR